MGNELLNKVPEMMKPASISKKIGLKKNVMEMVFKKESPGNT